MTNEHLMTQDHVVMVGEVVAERYEITKHLGTGGFAKVFRAFDKVIERDVAIKFLDLRGVPGGNSMVNTVLERFRREAKLAAKIPHRNVVNIYDIGQLDEMGYRPYIVMELLDGFDLEEQLNDHGPLRPERLLPLFVDCLDALGDAHELGIVHKDLKPSNLFLSNPGVRSESLRIVDFGIAHIKGTSAEEHETTESSKRLTATGQILGTLQYLTPEYIATQTVSPALDVYQMALILVELLSGERVIKTDNAFECLRIHTFGLLEIPDYLLSSTLGDVLRRALESDHLARYANAKEFADELSKIDPRSVPKSPRFVEAEVYTRPLANTISSPSLPMTGNHHKPNTGGFEVPLTSELEMGKAPEQAVRHPDLGTTHQPLRAAHNRGETESTSVSDLASTVSSSEELSRLDGYEPPIQQGSGKLFAVLGVIALLILLAGGALAVLMDGKKVKENPDDAVIVADKAQTPPTDTPPEVTEVKTEQLEVITNDPPVEETNPSLADKPTEAVQKPDTSKKSHLYPKTQVVLTTTPSDATISIEGVNHQSPAIVVIPEGQKEGVEVQVSRKRYDTRTVLVTRGKKAREVTLNRTKSQQPAKAVTKTTEPAAEVTSTKPKRELKLVD